jgi:curli biogenesis system outer membrane secretion channel CsgG
VSSLLVATRSAVLCIAVLSLGLNGACASTGRAVPANWDDSYLDRTGTQQSTKPVIAVLPIDTKGSVPNVDIKVSDILATALAQSGRFELVEREKIENILSEQKLKLSGAVDDASQAAEIGQLLGAEAVVIGVLSSATQQKVDKFAYDLTVTDVRIDVRAVSTTTGKILLSESAEGSSGAKTVTTASGQLVSGAVDFIAEYNKAAVKAASGAAKALASKFPVMGFVLSVSGDEITTDVGGDKAIGKGDVFVVFRALERIVHPVTKKPVGWKKKVLGLVKVKSFDKTSSITEPDGLDAELKPGDIVVLQPRS